MSSYLKYYFELGENEKLSLNSIECRKGEYPVKPKNFLKWYDKGDIDFSLSADQISVIGQCESPLFASMYIPRKINFKVSDFQKQ